VKSAGDLPAADRSAELTALTSIFGIIEAIDFYEINTLAAANRRR
jgi:hypothetical protein